MHTLFAWIIRWRFLVLALMGGLTAFLGSHLYPVEEIKFDYSFKRLFLAYGGNQDHLRQFHEDFGDDVGLVSVLFILPDPQVDVPADQISGTIFEPKVVRALEAFTDALKATEEIDSEQVVSLVGLARLHGSVQLNTVLTELQRLDSVAEKTPEWTPSKAIAALEGRGPPGARVPAALTAAVRTYQQAKVRLLRHRLYVSSVFNQNATVTSVIARFRPEFPDDADRKTLISGLTAPEELGPVDSERLAALRLSDVLRTMPAGTEVHLSGVPVIQKTYTDITLHDMSTYVPLISAAMALLLFLLFRSLWATLLPMTAVGVATLWSMGFMQWQGEPINIINSVIPVLILVIGVADAIHIISRYGQVSRDIGDKQQAIVQTMVHMAPPCLLAALTTAVGFASLLAANIPSIRVFGTYAAYSILFAFVIQMTLMPIGLSLASRPKQRPARSAHEDASTRFFEWVSQVVFRRRRTIVALAVAVLAVSALGISQLSDESHVLEELKSDHPTAQALFKTQEHLTGVLVHSVAFHGKELADWPCAKDSDCVDPACDPNACQTQGCCDTRICKTIDRAKKLKTQLRLNKDDLTSQELSPTLDALDGALSRFRSAVFREAASEKKAVTASQGDPPQEDELVIEDEEDIVLEQEEAPKGAAEPAVASQQPRGTCFESVKNPAFVKAIAAIDDWLTTSEKHRTIVSRVMTMADLLREMHLAIVGSEDDGNYRIPEDLDRRQIEELLKELKGDPSNIVGRIITDDFTRTNITIQANDAGTKAWSRLEADLLERLETDFGEGSELSGKFDTHITGSSTLAHGALHSIVHDMSTSIALAFLFIWILISILFRSVRVGFIAMVPNLWPLMITLAIMGFGGISLRVSSVIIFTISLGIAVDDTIHYLARLREEARLGQSLEDVIRKTTHGTGRAVMLTTVILVTGLSVNGLSDFIAMEQFGLLSAFTLTMALIGVLFLLPTLVQIFHVDEKLRPKPRTETSP